MGFNGIYPLVISYTLLLKPWPSRNSWNLPTNSMVDLSIVFCKRLPEGTPIRHPISSIYPQNPDGWHPRSPSAQKPGDRKASGTLAQSRSQAQGCETKGIGMRYPIFFLDYNSSNKVDSRYLYRWIGLRENFNRKTPYEQWENRWFPVKIFP